MTPPAWLGHTPTGQDLARLPLPWFHSAVDRLLAETVPRRYWERVIASREQRKGR